MYWLVENDQQLKYFIEVNKKQKDSEAFLEIIKNNDYYHPSLSTPYLYYLRPIKYRKGFIFPVKHNDTFSLNPNLIDELFNSFNTLYVRNKKQSLYFLNHHNIQDINFISNIEDINTDTKVHQFFYRTHGHRKDINSIIPVVKHYEKCEKIYEHVEPIILQEKPKSFNFYNNQISPIFYLIEKNGIQINPDQFQQFYQTEHDEYSISNNKIYTQYNLYTTTRRPSNSFNNINFSALNKENHSRTSFIPENDMFIEIDISAYHPTLISKLIGMDINPSVLYEQIGKEQVFQQIYGGIQDEYLNIPYFSKCKEFILNKWGEYQKNNYVLAPISNFCIKDIENPNPYKLFNYILQNMETSYNMKILKDVLKILNNKKSKIVLYVYDSILIDFSKEDGPLLLDEIKNVFTNNKLNIKIKTGHNYDTLSTL